MAQTVKNLPAMWETQSLGWEDPWRRKWQPTPVFLPREFHGQRSLAGYSPWDHKELVTTQRIEIQIIKPVKYQLMTGSGYNAAINTFELYFIYIYINIQINSCIYLIYIYSMFIFLIYGNQLTSLSCCTCTLLHSPEVFVFSSGQGDISCGNR